MIVDTSAIMAVAKREPDAQVYALALERAAHPRISAATYVELVSVADAGGFSGGMDELVALYGLEVVDVTWRHAELAREGLRRFRSGRHGLNYGDSFAYALSKATGEPLLFKGEDFARTDVVSALA